MSSTARLQREQLEKFSRCWGHLLEIFPAARKMATAEAIGKIKQEVDRQIVRQGVNDRNFHIRNGQRTSLVSESDWKRGGYGKVAPVNTRIYDQHGKVRRWKRHILRRPVTYPQLTDWLEHGHKARGTERITTSVLGYSYVGRKKKKVAFHGVVPGRMFYSWSRFRAQEIGLKAAGQVMEQLKAEFDLR